MPPTYSNFEHFGSSGGELAWRCWTTALGSLESSTNLGGMVLLGTFGCKLLSQGAPPPCRKWSLALGSLEARRLGNGMWCGVWVFASQSRSLKERHEAKQYGGAGYVLGPGCSFTTKALPFEQVQREAALLPFGYVSVFQFPRYMHSMTCGLGGTLSLNVEALTLYVNPQPSALSMSLT